MSYKTTFNQRSTWQIYYKIQLQTYFDYFSVDNTPLSWLLTLIRENPSIFTDKQHPIWSWLYFKITKINYKNKYQYYSSSNQKRIYKLLSNYFPNTKWYLDIKSE